MIEKAESTQIQIEPSPQTNTNEIVADLPKD